MRVSELGQQQVRPRDFWVAVGGVTLLLGVMGVCFTRTGRLPPDPPWLGVGFLLLVWGAALLGLLRHGRKAFPLWRMAGTVGYTLFEASHLVPRLGRAEGLGTLLMVGGLLWPWVEFGKRHPSAPHVTDPPDAT